MPLPLPRAVPDVIELWGCPICNHEATSLTALGRHMGKTSHGVVVVKNVGVERETLVMVTRAFDRERSDPSIFPLPPIFRNVE